MFTLRSTYEKDIPHFSIYYFTEQRRKEKQIRWKIKPKWLMNIIKKNLNFSYFFLEQKNINLTLNFLPVVRFRSIQLSFSLRHFYIHACAESNVLSVQYMKKTNIISLSQCQNKIKSCTPLNTLFSRTSHQYT